MNKQERQLVETVWDYYETAGRHTLPWRQTHDPYRILVSELMLQQTQVERVIPKYRQFIAVWPTAQHLAQASLGEVLTAWQGLGYNRRAKYLHQATTAVCALPGALFPTTRPALEQLPGVGPYTAGAILAFAYNQPVVLIETNVRRVFLHHLFPGQVGVADAALLPSIEKTVPANRAREWYAALMDYGSYLKTTIPNPNRRSQQYAKQSTFAGSDREIRGAILRVLTAGVTTETGLKKQLADFASPRVEQQLTALVTEGLVQCHGSRLSL